MKCLVTGGAGFIGSHLTEALLVQGHHVTIWDNFSTGRLSNLDHLSGNEALRVEEVDLSQPSLLPLPQNLDWVFHLAALADVVPSIENAESYFRANVVGTFNLLQTLRGTPIKKFVYAASSSCYGIPDVYPTSELAANNPQYPYALTKLMGEQIVMHWASVYELPAVSLRLFNVYGPRSRTSGTYGAVLGVFLAQKLANQPFTLVGDGTQTRDFTYVTDVARAFIQAAKSDVSNEVLNIGSGRTVSVNEVVRLLDGPSVSIPKRPGEPDCTFADITKAKEMLGWEPEVQLEQGIAQMLANLEHWRQAPVWTPESIAEATKEWFARLS